MNEHDERRRRVEEETARTLAELENLENITPGPYFFARLQANLSGAAEIVESRLLRFILNNRATPALLGLVLVVNALTAVMILKGRSEKSSTIRDACVEILADEYLLTGTSSGIDVETQQVEP